MFRSIAAAAMLAIAGASAVPAAQATVITQEYFEGFYDYSEFFANADGKEFPVQVRGNPFANQSIGPGQESFERALITVMQAHKPPPRLTFVNATTREPLRPNYRFALLFNPSTAGPVHRTCSSLGTAEMVPTVAGRVVLEMAFCRNDQTMSSLKARFDAASVNDPQFGRAFDQVFSALLPRRNPMRGEDPFGRKN